MHPESTNNQRTNDSREQFVISQPIKLKGKTKKGKERIKKWGEFWQIKEVKPSKLLITSLNSITTHLGERDLRWIDLPEDIDFEIVKE